MATENSTGALYDGVVTALRALAARGENDGRWHFRRAERWGRLHVILGLPAAVLSAVAAATGFASTAGRIPAAIIALGAGAFAAAATFLDARARQHWHDRLAGEWFALASDANLKLNVDIHNRNWLTQESRRELQDLLKRQEQLLRGRLGTEEPHGNSRPGPAVA